MVRLRLDCMTSVNRISVRYMQGPVETWGLTFWIRRIIMGYNEDKTKGGDLL